MDQKELGQELEACKPDVTNPVDIKELLYTRFGMCGCSELEDILVELKKLFEWIDAQRPVSYRELLGSAGAFYIIAGICDDLGLIDHGSSIRTPFITEEGRKFLLSIQDAKAIDDASGVAFNGEEV